jgi:cytoskeletal protein CcmA (bactofilin family)
VAELVIARTARIVGDVAYDSLTIEQGARVEGCFSPRGANAAAAVADSLIAIRTPA